jgi:phage baseplate assembly protein W
MTDTPFLGFPYRPDARGRSATVGREAQIRAMIEQVLFTAPGERVMRPDFGCGLKELLFQPASEALVAATQQMVHGALLRWLEEVIAVQRVTVAARESTLTVTVVYAPRLGGPPRVETFSMEAAG